MKGLALGLLALLLVVPEGNAAPVGPAGNPAGGPAGNPAVEAAKRGGPMGRRNRRGAATKTEGAAAKGEGAEGGKGKGTERRAAVLGNSMMRKGNPRQAIFHYKKALEQDPDAPQLHVGLGRALARMGSCATALDHLLPYEDTPAFGVEAAISTSGCANRMGLVHDAIHFDRLAVSLDEDNVRARTNLALHLDEAGDADGAQRVLDDLLLLQDERDASLYAQAALALRHGDVDAFDAIAALWDREDRRDEDLLRLRIVAWMDLDDPQEAWNELQRIRTLRASRSIYPLRLETLRRLGQAAEVIAIADARNRSAEGVDADAALARAYVDVGEIDAAQQIVDAYGDSDEPEVVATQWYLARARGDAEAQADAAARYAALPYNSPLRTLEQLVPVHERG